MNRIATTSIIVLASALLVSASALADAGTSAAANNPAGATPSTATTTGSINLDPTPEQRMKDCMAIWDPGTHMTKKQWRRTCKTTLGEFMN